MSRSPRAPNRGRHRHKSAAMAARHAWHVATRERRYDKGTERGRELITGLGRELRNARSDRGLSLRATAAEARLSAPTLSRIERGMATSVSFITVARLMATVGLELSARAYPGGQPLRAAGHVELLAALRFQLHRSLRWATEVPLPSPGDLRAWDAIISGPGWMYGVEAETSPRDAQALARRLALKHRDSNVDGVILLLRRGRRSASFLRDARPVLAPNYPADGRRTLQLLQAGADPGGSAIAVL